MGEIGGEGGKLAEKGGEEGELAENCRDRGRGGFYMVPTPGGSPNQTTPPTFR
jgi:hypothetical protein